MKPMKIEKRLELSRPVDQILQWDVYKRQLQKLSEEKQRILDAAEKQAQKQLEEVKAEGEALLEELRQSQKTMKLHAVSYTHLDFNKSEKASF